MKRIILIIYFLFSLSIFCSFSQNNDTLYISNKLTTHVIFPTDLTYIDISSQNVIGKVLTNRKNIFALKARSEFSDETTITALEASGEIRTFIVKYKELPKTLLIDFRKPHSYTNATEGKNPDFKSEPVKKSTTPLENAMKQKQSLFHIASKNGGVTIKVINIRVMNDETFIVFEIINKSGISYKVKAPAFVIESRKTVKRKLLYEKAILPKSTVGSINIKPYYGNVVGYSFGKITLEDSQKLSVYFYEEEASRNIVVTISANDILRAIPL